MSFELPTKRSSTVARARWSGAAFLVEAMLLLVFIMVSLAVFTQLFAASAERANASRSLTDAVSVATSVAERFCADPTSVEGEYAEDDLQVVCQVTSEKRAGGVMYYATINVYGADASTVAATASKTTGADAADSGDAEIASSDLVAAPPAVPTVEPLYSVQTAKFESGA